MIRTALRLLKIILIIIIRSSTILKFSHRCSLKFKNNNLIARNIIFKSRNVMKIFSNNSNNNNNVVMKNNNNNKILEL